MQINLRLPPAYRYLCQYEIQQQTNDRRKPPVPDGMDGDYPSTGPQLENARRGTRQSGEHPDRLAKNRTLSADLHHPQQPDRSQTVTAKTKNSRLILFYIQILYKHITLLGYVQEKRKENYIANYSLLMQNN